MKLCGIVVGCDRTLRYPFCGYCYKKIIPVSDDELKTRWMKCTNCSVVYAPFDIQSRYRLYLTIESNSTLFEGSFLSYF